MFISTSPVLWHGVPAPSQERSADSHHAAILPSQIP